jgi:hypothetical protein
MIKKLRELVLDYLKEILSLQINHSDEERFLECPLQEDYYAKIPYDQFKHIKTRTYEN